MPENQLTIAEKRQAKQKKEKIIFGFILWCGFIYFIYSKIEDTMIAQIGQQYDINLENTSKTSMATGFSQIFKK